jgi:ubiquinone biosynthesis protein
MIGERKLLVSPATLRATVERLGPTWIKIGQYLALRPDLIPQEYCDELLGLVDNAPSFPFEIARRIITEDLGRDPVECFAGFDPIPVSAASLAQVYKARTHRGDVVAVKVKREGVDEQTRKDFARARLVQPLVQLFKLVPGVSEREALDQMQEWMLEELNFELERRNLKQMHALLRDDKRVRVPRVYDDLSGPRVITMDYLAGVRFSDVLRLVREGRLERIEELGLNREELAENLLRSCLDQVFRHEFFHADTHPGNIIALPGNVIGFVDFGLTERLDAHLQPGVRRFVSAVYLDDIDGMVASVLQLLIREEDADVVAFEAEFRKQHRVWTRTRSDGTERHGDWTIRNYMVAMMRAARPCGMRLPASLLSMYRSILTAETVALQIGGTSNIMATGRSFFAGLTLERFLNRLQPDEVGRALLPYLDFIEEPGDKYLRLFSDVADGQFVLRVESSEAPASRRSSNQRARLVTTSIVLVAISLLQLSARGVMLADRIPLSGLLWAVWAFAALVLAFLWRGLK